MDTTKLRLCAAVGGALFGLVGAILLAYTLVLALTPYIGELWAAVAICSLFMSAALGCIYLFLLPQRPTQVEMDKAEDLAADTLADLPFDTAERIARKHPISTLTLALAAGYFLLKDPSKAARHATSLMNLL